MLVDLATTDDNLATYLNWVKENLAKTMKGGKPRSQAINFATYLRRVSFSSRRAFARSWLLATEQRGDFVEKHKQHTALADPHSTFAPSTNVSRVTS